MKKGIGMDWIGYQKGWIGVEFLKRLKDFIAH
jgi:hypothetical protein